MKSNKSKFFLLLLAVVILFTGARAWFRAQSPAFQASLPKEEIDRAMPAKVDEVGSGWITLPFGYTFGPWPTHFRDNPIVMTMGYTKGPPQNFIHEMKQIWSPAQAEVIIEGPRTPIATMTVWQWQSCINSSWFCLKEKKKLYETTLLDLEKYKAKDWKLSWFESNDLASPRGIHVQFETDSSEVNRFVVFTDKGTSQNFTIITSRSSIGQEAVGLFSKIVGGMSVKDDLTDARLFTKNRLQTIDLEKIRGTQDPNTRYLQMIQAQNLLFSQLSIDPRLIAPFFHLAGVSHLLGSSLIHEKTHLFGNQDSWIISIQPLLSTLISYVKDFPEVGQTKEEKVAALKNMESLLGDYLLLEQKEQQKGSK